MDDTKQDEPRRSGPDVARELGMVARYMRDHRGQQVAETNQNTVKLNVSHLRDTTEFKESWDAGRFDILSEPSSPPACKGAPCGMLVSERGQMIEVPGLTWMWTHRPTGSFVLYCPVCRDKAANVASAVAPVKAIITAKPWKCAGYRGDPCPRPDAPSSQRPTYSSIETPDFCVVCQDKFIAGMMKNDAVPVAQPLPPYYGPLTAGIANVSRSVPQTIGRVVVAADARSEAWWRR
jgi:hypothetical protein